MRRFRFLTTERGIALPMALGMLMVLSISLVTVLELSSSGARHASRSRASDKTYVLGEAGVGEALSILGNASDPTVPTLLPSRTLTLEGGTATYSGSYASNVWTITSTGQIANPTGGSQITRTVTQTVTVTSTGANGSWDKVFLDFTVPSPYCIRRPMYGSFAAKGNVCMSSGGIIGSAGKTVTIDGNATIPVGASIGQSGVNVDTAAISGTCNGTTCNATQRVYANTYSSTVTPQTKPTIDFDTAYTSAQLGPAQYCNNSGGSFPGGFDNDYNPGNPPASFNNSRGTANLTTSTYTCQRLDGSGNVVAEISYNATNRVLTIMGTIFIDGSISFGTSPVHYAGIGQIYVSGSWSANDKVVCAGGSGSTSCYSSPAITTWTPTSNLMSLFLGGKRTSGNDLFMEESSAFQGLIYTKNDCWMEDNTHISGPFVCNRLGTQSETPTFYDWPAFGAYSTGELVDSGYQLTLGQQYG